MDGIVVCIGLSEDISKTLPWNWHHLDRLIVVTASLDHQTIDFAKRHGVVVVTCDDYREGHDSFNKGKCLNVGLDALAPSGWTLFFDADIMLNPSMYRMEESELDKDVLYYTTRHHIQSEAELTSVSDAWEAVMRMPHGPLDSMPYGYFQLWHPESKHLEPIQRVSEQFPTAGGVDQWWAFRWPEASRKLLPSQYDVGHLAHGGFGARWHGPSRMEVSKWKWVGWSRGDRTQVEPMPHGGVFLLIALDIGHEWTADDPEECEHGIDILRRNGSIEQIDIYWRAP